MKRLSLIAIAVIALTRPAAAEDTCPCIPLTHLWTVKSCDTWDCAAAEFNISNGSADTVVMPTGSDDVKWMVLHRIVGGATATLDPTFAIENYNGWTDASTRFGTIDSTLKPMILTAPDGKFVVVSRNMPEPRRRAVVH